jgi:hypothetical protein
MPSFTGSLHIHSVVRPTGLMLLTWLRPIHGTQAGPEDVEVLTHLLFRDVKTSTRKSLPRSCFEQRKKYHLVR